MKTTSNFKLKLKELMSNSFNENKIYLQNKSRSNSPEIKRIQNSHSTSTIKSFAPNKETNLNTNRSKDFALQKESKENLSYLIGDKQNQNEDLINQPQMKFSSTKQKIQEYYDQILSSNNTNCTGNLNFIGNFENLFNKKEEDIDTFFNDFKIKKINKSTLYDNYNNYERKLVKNYSNITENYTKSIKKRRNNTALKDFVNSYNRKNGNKSNNFYKEKSKYNHSITQKINDFKTKYLIEDLNDNVKDKKFIRGMCKILDKNLNFNDDTKSLTQLNNITNFTRIRYKDSNNFNSFNVNYSNINNTLGHNYDLKRKNYKTKESKIHYHNKENEYGFNNEESRKINGTIQSFMEDYKRKHNPLLKKPYELNLNF